MRERYGNGRIEDKVDKREVSVVLQAAVKRLPNQMISRLKLK
jgi:hypothetical protein